MIAQRSATAVPSRSRRSGSRKALLLTLAGLAALVSCGEETTPEPVLRPVRFEQVRAVGDERVRSFAGVARAGLEARLSFRVPGTVEAVPATVGQQVRKGRLLARIDPTDYELAVKEAEAGLAQADAAKRNADADYDRVRGLYESNNASLRELDAARAQSESSQAQADAAGQRLERAEQQLSYTFLRAPVDGTIASVDIEVNENVQAGQRIMLLAAGAEVKVEVALPESLISEVSIGQPVRVRLDALGGLELAGRVSEAGVAAVGTATTFPVTVVIEEFDPDVRSGMAAEVAFRFPRRGGAATIVPSVAVGEDEEGRFVFLLEPDGDGTAVVRRRPVRVGELTAAGIEVVEGLEAGELLVTAGVRLLSDGERVRAPRKAAS